MRLPMIAAQQSCQVWALLIAGLGEVDCFILQFALLTYRTRKGMSFAMAA